MDPMLELASRYFEVDRSKHVNVTADVNKQIKEALGYLKRRSSQNKVLPTTLWQVRDERATEVLADVFYFNPGIARKLCETRRQDLCPQFVRDLVNEARRAWQAEPAPSNRPDKRPIHELLEEYGYDVHETFPEALELTLLEKPALMEKLADHLKAALPFSMVLKKELEEIRYSREVRLASDLDAHFSGLLQERARVKADGGNGFYKQCRLLYMRWRLFWAEREIKAEGNHRSKSPPCTKAKKRTGERTPGKYPPKLAEEMLLFGLAVSGGGIRSATFNLGILQALADLDLLRRLDYLSGVSGGSHIAGWLGAWIKRQDGGVLRVQRWLSPQRSPTPDTNETYPIQFLRRFSNYLAPRKGFLSPDKWSIFSVWLGNTIPNLIVILLLLASLLCLPHLLLKLLNHPTWFKGHDPGWMGAVAIVLTVSLAVLIGLHLRRFDVKDRTGPRERRRSSPLWNQSGVLTTLVVGFLLLGLLGSSLLFWSSYNGNDISWPLTYGVICGAVLTANLCSRAWRHFFSCREESEPGPWQKSKAYCLIVGFALVPSLTGLIVLYLIFELFEHHVQQNRIAPLLGETEKMVIAFGPIVLIAVLSLVIMLQIGLLGRDLPDTHKEWWGRMGALLLMGFVAWTALSCCSFFGPGWVLDLYSWRSHLPFWATTISWLATTITGLRWGASAQTTAYPRDQDGRKRGRREWITSARLREWVARIAPYLFIAGLTVLVSYWLDAARGRMFAMNPSAFRWAPSLWKGLCALAPQWLLLLLSLVLMFLLAMFLASRFDINEFSMHHFYRNRLVRCYLGASRPRDKRNPNPFTGFDPEDDLSLSGLQMTPPDPNDLIRDSRTYSGPYLIFNTALNLVAGKELAWQERKAASFVLTPLYCGYELVRVAQHEDKHFVSSGYRPTAEYADRKALGPSLGSAMAISGAAVNPNMGYHSSPALSFLMALFNVRLGCWLGNTRHDKSWKRSFPTFGLTYLVNELLGWTDDTSKFINLSDGGHFENLGLYELVRRRCMYVIVCDAEEDSRFNFHGLGSAIRKCRNDFGIEITLNPDQLRPVREAEGDLKRSRTHYAVGEIIYSDDVKGTLLYMKTSLTGDEPGDVLEYQLRHAAFPQQSTLNQFFDESQFESYRALGRHIATDILGKACRSTRTLSKRPVKSTSEKADEDAKRNAQFIDRLFHRLQETWCPHPGREAAA